MFFRKAPEHYEIERSGVLIEDSATDGHRPRIDQATLQARPIPSNATSTINVGSRPRMRCSMWYAPASA